jgi:hypothetical protein
MGVRAFGEQPRNSEPSQGRSGGSASEQPSILDIGSVATGDESIIDTAVTGDAASDDGFVDPTSISTGTGSDRDAPYGRTKSGRIRNRPVGSGTRRGSDGSTPRKTATEVSGFVADILYSVHEIGATFLKIEELELSEDEASALGAGIVRVTEQYDVPLPDAKTMAWINLAKVMGKIYAPRIGAMKIRKRREKQQAKGPEVIMPFRASVG